MWQSATRSGSMCLAETSTCGSPACAISPGSACRSTSSWWPVRACCRRAPHTHIATVRVDPAHEAALLRSVTDALPNVTGIRVADILAAVASLLNQIAGALAATGALTLLAGLLVLVSAVAAGQRRRTREAIILRVLGFTSRQIRAAWLVEFALTGLAAGLIAALTATGASYGVAHYILHTPWGFSWQILIFTLAGGSSLQCLCSGMLA